MCECRKQTVIFLQIPVYHLAFIFRGCILFFFFLFYFKAASKLLPESISSPDWLACAAVDLTGWPVSSSAFQPLLKHRVTWHFPAPCGCSSLVPLTPWCCRPIEHGHECGSATNRPGTSPSEDGMKVRFHGIRINPLRSHRIVRVQNVSPKKKPKKVFCFSDSLLPAYIWLPLEQNSSRSILK